MKMKAVDVRKMSASELDAKLVELKKDLFNLRLQHATNQLDNPIRIAEVKKDIARVKTILRERQGRCTEVLKKTKKEVRTTENLSDVPS